MKQAMASVPARLADLVGAEHVVSDAAALAEYEIGRAHV